ncbi:initiation-specific alpha-1,6-mannosyltransferase [Nannizzia gypsea CBS 118893]|uniref:Initiation-specific alpha-1,6-mannosyltransferase n=1 Tax=Arthroderma gypseum (strain ATCC MYA-4604 / CBS 118893) TaxID=535722 RepID=E4UT52_ARTGP|nr:initiation-specific alpha-1,6-mannosyltransferase [Nannizzia gypsea CBS 118893]EFR01448.1 initiation-specific alpha-1,6-mannosyltransferase [Nannizzia gypsea CBS 118893]
MISFRKCVVIAFFILSGIFLLHTAHARPALAKTGFGTHRQRSEPLGTQITAKLGSKVDSTPEQEPEQEAEPEPEPEPKKEPEPEPTTLRGRLKYHFPYGVKAKFPGYIWQTWKYTPAQGEFDPMLRPLEASWTELHPGFVHQVVDDDSAVYFLKYLYASFPEVIEAYDALPLPVLKADFFRYLILHARGGIYSDIDTLALRAATEWIPPTFDRSTIGLVVGIEADPDRADWAKWYSRRIQFCQWTIQSKPGHPVLRDVIASITEETLRMKEEVNRGVHRPAVWTDAIFKHFNDPVNFPSEEGKHQNITALHFTGMTKQKQVGDVVILPITSFSPGVQQMGSEEIDSDMAFVQHEFSADGMLAGCFGGRCFINAGRDGNVDVAGDVVKLCA